jgi:hypothetical protein
MIIVREVWQLKPEYARSALEIMQEMDDLLGPGAHAHPGWVGHASFYQNVDRPGEAVLQYPWASRESHRDLVDREENMLTAFTEKYCRQPRRIDYYELVDVEVEDDHDEGHPA